MPRRLLPALLLTLTALLGPALAPAAASPATVPATGPAAVSAPADDDPDPAYPSDGDIARARAEADRKASDAAAIEARLKSAQSELDQAGRTAEQAVEAYNGAQVRLALARSEAQAAAARSAQAEQDRAEAAEAAARLAAAIYRLGSTPELSAIDALLGARGPRAVTEQAAAVGAAGATTRQILDAAISTAQSAADAQRSAQGAADEAQRAAVAVEQAKAEAQAGLAAQQALVTTLGAQREQLLADLAAARHTTVELERQRQAALEAIAARQAAEAAKAQAEAEAAAAAAAALAAQRPSAPLSPTNAAWSERGAQSALAFARTKIGLPYIWGGEGPDGYDCSGLTMLAWRQAGKHLTHFAADQYAESTPVTYRQLRPGDLVFWTHTGRAADIYHVAIYLGDDQMIEAPRPGAAIKQASLWIMGHPDFYARP